ncbi:hypothetical protein [Amaricoccus macauensis]|uniref:hypothetical protein n=1 Tax=Amaricoccus macauensis TaxID=57001 RepID=UPI003C7CC527
MHFLKPRSAPSAVMFLLMAAAGLAVTLYLYLTPLTGVNGTTGAALVVFACAAMTLAGLVLVYRPWGGFSELLRYLCLLAAVCTAAAALFLQAYWLLWLMAFAVVFILFDFLARKGEPA